LLDRDDVTEAWVKTAVGDERADHSAVRDITVKRFGEKTVAYDPSDPQANAEATLKGYTVIHGGMLSGGEWANVKAAGLILPAGQVTPSNSTLETSPDGVPPIDPDKWTPGMAGRGLRRGGWRRNCSVSTSRSASIAYRRRSWRRTVARSLKFNLQRLGHAWFNTPDQVKVDALLIHEFAHHRVSDHLSEAFHDECCRLGAKLRYFHQTLLDF
jgi:hypothetical protein